MNKGKFIVIDGIDGSGKEVQTKLLAKRLKRNGYKVLVFDFPQHGKKSAGPVDEYLNGKYGTADEVGPYRASIFFASDRYAASSKIRNFLNSGGVVISNRYATANMGHQGSKIEDAKERKKFFAWLYDLEYRIFSIPKPDASIILHVDADIARKMINKKEKREYIMRRKKDMHEMDRQHLKKAEETYVEITGLFPGFIPIKCVRNGKMMTKKEIGDIVWNRVMDVLASQNKIT